MAVRSGDRGGICRGRARAERENGLGDQEI
jgi:hypothetical protein